MGRALSMSNFDQPSVNVCSTSSIPLSEEAICGPFQSENAVSMKQKGNIVGKVWDIAAANNKGCIKV